MNEFESQIIQTILSCLPKDIELIQAYPFKYSRFSHVFMCDAVLVKDGRLIAGIDIARALEGNISHRKAMLNSHCKSKNIPYTIITDGKKALFCNLNIENDEHIVELEQAISKLVGLYEEVIDGVSPSLYDKFLKEATRLEISLSSLTKEDLLKGAKEMSNGEVHLSFEGETALLKALLGSVEDNKVCRYTSFSSLKRILDNGTASVCSIVGMNDKSECYYYDSYVNDDCCLDLATMPQSYIAELNSNFIMSCSEITRLDKLTMWRMYGDDAKGVCIVYSIDDLGDKFLLAPVCYANEDRSHPKLDFLKSIQQDMHVVLPSIDAWKHFFKPYEYADEKEIRLLYKDSKVSKYKWIQATGGVLCPIVEFPILKTKNRFPLILKEVWLGPKCDEKEVNRSQLEMYANQLEVKYKNGIFKVMISEIDNYR